MFDFNSKNTVSISNILHPRPARRDHQANKTVFDKDKSYASPAKAAWHKEDFPPCGRLWNKREKIPLIQFFRITAYFALRRRMDPNTFALRYALAPLGELAHDITHHIGSSVV